MINVLNLFDGISCGRVALERAGIPVKRYYASEIDKYAITVAQKNYPDTVQLGSVVDLRGWMFPKIDLLMAGSPCKGFSFIGKQLNFNDPESKLFFEFVRLLHELKQRNPGIKFLLENVKMKKEYQDYISKLVGVEPVFINSALLSAQNRRRLYWTNIEGVILPEDKKILLKDILQVQGIPVIKNKGVLSLREEKSQCLDANYYKGVDNHGQRTMILNPESCDVAIEDLRYLTDREIERAINKHRAQTWRTGSKMGNVAFPTVLDGKSKCVNAMQIVADRSVTHVDDGYGIRMLTPIECERLQTLPDNYTDGISRSKRLHALGNGWTVDVIAHILSFYK